MATVTAHLVGGLQIGDVIHTEAEIREPTSADLIEAQAAAEKIVMVQEGDRIVPQLLISPSRIALEMLARQIVRIGDHPGPLSLDELKKLKKADDIGILQNAAEQLDAVSFKETAAQMENRGRNSAGSD